MRSKLQDLNSIRWQRVGTLKSFQSYLKYLQKQFPNMNKGLFQLLHQDTDKQIAAINDAYIKLKEEIKKTPTEKEKE